MASESKKKEFFKYSTDDLKAAVKDIKENKLKIREAGRKYNVPHSTLINKLKELREGNVESITERKMGPATILTKQEEVLLCNWIKALATKGIPIDKSELQDTVSEIIRNDGRDNPFTNNQPGEKWFKLFMRRHPDISQRHTEVINMGKARVTEEKIKQWHESLKDHLVQENALSILEDPSRIFNADESGFYTNPKSGLMLGPRGLNDFYEISKGPEKESITVLVTLNAVGEIYPPMVVYPHERIPQEICRNTPEGWINGRSTSGWMTGPTFFSYIANDFLPEVKRRNIQLPILFFIDGHKSHLTYNTTKFCEENGIILY